MKKMVLCSLLLMPLCLSAVLPPLYTSVDEIKGMLEDPALGKTLQSGESIQQIARNPQGFTIMTNKSSVQVEVKELPQNMPGPAKFGYRFSTPKPIETTTQQ